MTSLTVIDRGKGGNEVEQQEDLTKDLDDLTERVKKLVEAIQGLQILMRREKDESFAGHMDAASKGVSDEEKKQRR